MKLLTPEEVELFKYPGGPSHSLERQRAVFTAKAACELIARIYPGRPFKDWKDALRALGESHED